MTRENLIQKSKRLSWLLRHGAPSVGLAMDAAGWVEVAEVRRELRFSESDLADVVGQNDKRRFEMADGRIRACQGHSAQAVASDDGVSLAALEASWEPYEAAGSVWHGTHVAAAEAIAREGIVPQARTHVHLAPTPTSKVGKRHAVAVLLEVATAKVREHGIALYRSPNGVILARRIPAACIVGVQGCSRDGEAQVRRLRQAFHLE